MAGMKDRGRDVDRGPGLDRIACPAAIRPFNPGRIGWPDFLFRETILPPA